MMNTYSRWQKYTLEQTLKSSRVIMITGPRQCGKTTLVRKLISENVVYRTLDDITVRQAAESDPNLFVNFAPKDGTLIIDEVQKVPDLLPAIKNIVDRSNRAGQFVITGSANILSLPTVQESMAGRVARVRLHPLSQGEIMGIKPTFLEQAFAQKFLHPKSFHSKNDLIDIIFRGGFPEAVRLEGKARKNWHIDYINAIIEHDLNDIANIRRIEVIKDLVRVLAAWSSKFMDISAISSSLAADRRTLTSYISALQSFYIVESVPAWHKTDYDRVGKQAKLFMTDTGTMTALLGWKQSDLALDSDKPGKLFETFAYNELAAQIDSAEDTYYCYHYRDRDQREIDLLIERDDHSILAVEVKSGSTVRKTDFKHIEWFKANLVKGKPVVGIILYTGSELLPFGENLWAVPFDYIWSA